MTDTETILHAMRREYHRRVEKGMPDTPESWHGFVAGWHGRQNYVADTLKSYQGGGTSAALGSVLWAIGGIALGLIALSYYLQRDNMIMSRAFWVGVAGVVMVAAGSAMFRIARRQGGAAMAAYYNRWGPREES